jgi:hypothetical protein
MVSALAVGALGLALTVVPAAQGVTYYVSTNGNNTTGLDWANAFTNIQRALSTSVSGDAIYLAGQTFWVTNELRWTNVANVAIEGGWEGVDPAPGNNNPLTWPTVIRVVTPAYTQRVFFVESVTGILTKVTIQDGYCARTNTLADTWGGGLFVTNSTLTLDTCQVLSNRVFRSNALNVGGGGLYAINSSVLITNCVFRGNVALQTHPNGVALGGVPVRGGAAAFTGAGAFTRISDSVFTANLAEDNGQLGSNNRGSTRGGAVYSEGLLNIRNSVFAFNIARVYFGDYLGGAVSSFTNSIVSIQNCAFWGNRSYALSGKAISIYSYGGAGAVYVTNTVLSVGNCDFLYNDDEGLRVAGIGALGVSNSIFWGNGDDLVGFPTDGFGVLTNVWYCDIQNGMNLGVQGCFSADPLLERGAYRATNSPCRDAGGALAADLGLDTRTTRADGIMDGGPVDLGYHFPYGINWSVADLYV